MKLLKLLLLLVISTNSLNGFSQESQEKDYSLAKVGEKINGVYIFIEATPYYEYDFIATLDIDKEWNHMFRPTFEKFIEKARKKYPNFNGIIIRGNDGEKAELIRFREIEATAGGFRIGDKIVFKDDNKPGYGEIIGLDIAKQTVQVKTWNIYGEEIIDTKKIPKINAVTEVEFEKQVEQIQEDAKKFEFLSEEKVSFPLKDVIAYGKIVSIDKQHHTCLINYLNDYGDEEAKKIDFLDLTKIETSLYESKLQEKRDFVLAHTFIVGDKVSFTLQNVKLEKKTYAGEITLIDSKSHQATITYIDSENIQKVAKVDILKLSKTN